MRVALFVEGSAPLADKDYCKRLWNEVLLPGLGRAPMDVVVPIGKNAISRLRGLPTSNSAPGLDERIQRLLVGESSLDPTKDAVVIAWDLEPVDTGRPRCAFHEKKGLYAGIATSPLLVGTAWAQDAARRAQRLDHLAGQPPTGAHLSQIRPGTVLGVCMDPMFEGLMAHDGRAIRNALDLTSDPVGWPTGWGTDERNPSDRLLGPAIDAMRRIRPPAKVRRKIFNNWRCAKDEWGHLLLGKLLADPSQAAIIRAHAIAQRLSAILPPMRGTPSSQAGPLTPPPPAAPGRRRRR